MNNEIATDFGLTKNNMEKNILNRARTLADYHPLMDSDCFSTNPTIKNSSATCNNFPDVIPSCKNLFEMLRTSPDLISSESEADLSQFTPLNCTNFQSVALINTQTKTSNCKEDIRSLDSISNHSFDVDEDIEHLASLSPDDDDDAEGPDLYDQEDDLEIAHPIPKVNCAPKVELPQYTADEERHDSRNWQKITLPDGTTREIDMRVIEPYKRILSHGGYLQKGGHNAIVIFCACHLPDRSRTDYNYVMDNLFLYVVKTLEQLVTEDYVLIYMHGGSNRRNIPPLPWIKKCYQLVDKRLRKSIKNLYLVHPTFLIKSIIFMTRPFVSSKFWRKLVYVRSLEELNTHVVIEKAAIPEKVKDFDSRH